ncbi:MAG: DEAD/DEAH box helicase [Anaerolineae bacterium]|nr:MAG: DEAD/DEAH box helicase [Anaerolineae bacterium]
MTFNTFKLDPRLQAGIQRAGYTVPTPIQKQAIPAAMAGQDIIGTAQTGTGKTAAFVLPILHKLLQGERRQHRALIVTPTRELALQIHEAIQDLGQGTGIRSATIYGGVGIGGQIKALKGGAEILVACPGRLLDLINQGHARLNKIEILVLDEADRMLDMGFLPDVKRILGHVPPKRQTMLFSATFPREIEDLGRAYLYQPHRISVDLAAPATTVTHALYPVSQHLKTPLLLELLKSTDTNSVLIFTRTKHRAQKVTRQLEQANYKVTALHSNRSQGQRTEALTGFKKGRYQIMVATDIAARGLDIESISHVINYDMPDTADAYIHRIGRTGRAERTGDAFTLVSPEDEVMVRTLEKIMKQKLHREIVTGFNYKAPAPPRSAQTDRPTSRAPRRDGMGGRPARSSNGHGARPNERAYSQTRTSAGNGSTNGHSNGQRPQATAATATPAASRPARPNSYAPNGKAGGSRPGNGRPANGRPGGKPSNGNRRPTGGGNRNGGSRTR